MRRNGARKTIRTRRTPGDLPRQPKTNEAVDGRISRTKQRKLVEDARTLYMRLWPEVGRGGACVFHAVALQLLGLKRHKLELMLQAGSAWWPRLDEETRGGDPRVMFGYQFEEGATLKTWVRGQLVDVLPEVHTWLGIRHQDGSGTLVDPTTGTWPEASLELHGIDWPGRKPPPFLWEHQDRIDEKWERPYSPSYHCSLVACDMVATFAAREIYPRIGEALDVDWKKVAFV